MNSHIIIAIVGLLSIIFGTSLVSSSLKIRRRYTYPLLILGGICLLIYSIYLKDLIFIVLQSVFIISSVVGLIKINEKNLKGKLK
jgi:lipid-A-disaccharide synthase-like uncharacterized protein